MASAAWQRKNVVVCGASAGLGLELARQLASQGARVLMVARNAQRLADAHRILHEESAACDLAMLAADLIQPSGAEQLAAWIGARQFGPVDLLIKGIRHLLARKTYEATHPGS